MSKIHLQNAWTFFLESGSDLGTRQKLGSFQTVQDFWRFWNNIDPSHLPKQSTLFLMKNDFSPTPESDEHSTGGKWILTKRSEEASKLWLLSILCLVGEQFTHSDDMCGTSLCLRPRNCSISIWNVSANDKRLLQETEKELCGLLSQDEASFRYSTHAEAKALNQCFGLKIESPIGLTRPCSTQSEGSSPSTPKLLTTMDNEQDDFSTPFIELENEYKRAPPTPVITLPKIESPEQRNLTPFTPFHRRSQSHDVTGSAQLSPPSTGSMSAERRRSCSNLLELEADSESQESPRISPTSSLRLPRRHRRRGKRSTDATDPTTRKIALDVPIATPVVTFEPTSDNVTTTYTTVPNRHRRKNSSGGGGGSGGSSIVIKTIPRGKVSQISSKILGISRSHWLLFATFVAVLVVAGWLYFYYDSGLRQPTVETCALLQIC